jgi:hypothetical protein
MTTTKIAILALCTLPRVLSEAGSFTVYSLPVELRYGEVHNRIQYIPEDGGLPLPKDVVAKYASGDVAMAISGFDVDMVRVGPDGSETQVKLNDHYLHHYILQFGQKASMKKMVELVEKDSHAAHMIKSCHGMTGAGVRMFQEKMARESPELSYVSFGSAAGSEYRHNPQRLQAPYRLILKQPQVWAPTLHIINTNLADNHTATNKENVSRLLECPCTPQRRIDTQAGTIDGKKPDPPISCSQEFAATGNPSCHLSTYQGGWRCCEDGVFLVDTSKECKTPDCSEKIVDKVFMKYTFYYEDALASYRAIEAAACCDVTSDEQGAMNIEYDVTTCPAGTAPEKCVHIAESIQPVGYFSRFPKQSEPHGRDLVDLVFAAPHLHWAGNSIELIDHETNKTLCEVHRGAGVIYGQGQTAGDQNGYLVGLTPCSWKEGEAPRFRRDHLLRTRAVYNATSNHTGVMSLWLMQVSAVPKSDADIVV